MSDTVRATDWSAYAGGGLPVVTVQRIASVLPARVAAEYDGVFVTYGRLNTVIETYRAVTGAEGMDGQAALYAALIHVLPGLSAITDPVRLGVELGALVERMVGDTAA